jgi:hypothetical protein
MSVYRQQQTEMNDLDTIEACVKEMPRPKHGICTDAKQPREGNFAPVRHKEPVNLVGFQGDQRKETAQLVIPRHQASSNDVGFYQQKPGGPVTMHISNADQHMHFNEKWVADLKKRYVEKQARKLAKKNGIAFKGAKKLANGKTRLTFVMA